MSEIIDCNARRYPLHGSDDGMIVFTVLCKRIEGKFKACAAIVPENGPDYSFFKKWVQVNGNQLRFNEAQAIWPSLTVSDYAR